MEQCLNHEPHAGIQCLGLLDSQTGKLGPLPAPLLADLAPLYDITLIEADGSKGLPCKGWLDNEPVIPEYCTHTIGVMSMDALGMAATEDSVHRLSEFLSMTDLNKGDTITTQALVKMILSPSGMFKNSVGRRYLVVNKVEDDATAGAAIEFLREVKEKYPNRFERMLCGSVLMNEWQEVKA